jgi:hypothetical protein
LAYIIPTLSSYSIVPSFASLICLPNSSFLSCWSAWYYLMLNCLFIVQ